MFVVATVVFITVNIWTLWRFRTDKLRAIARLRRIPERELLMLAAIGGTPGAFFARHRYRHKTYKQPFSFRLWLIAAVQTAAITGLLVPIDWLVQPRAPPPGTVAITNADGSRTHDPGRL